MAIDFTDAKETIKTDLQGLPPIVSVWIGDYLIHGYLHSSNHGRIKRGRDTRRLTVLAVYLWDPFEIHEEVLGTNPDFSLLFPS